VNILKCQAKSIFPTPCFQITGRHVVSDNNSEQAGANVMVTALGRLKPQITPAGLAKELLKIWQPYKL